MSGAFKWSHSSRVRALQRRLDVTGHWSFVLFNGEQLTAEQRAKIKPGDTVYIRHIGLEPHEAARV